MQEKFALRKTLKKVAAVGTSLALVGVTVSGALAAGLGDLPAPFGNNPASNVVVFGSHADDNSVSDVVSALGGMPGSSTAYSAGGTLAALNVPDDFETGRREHIAVASRLDGGTAGVTAFGSATLTDSSDIGLKRGKLSLDHGVDRDYDYHEEVRLTSRAILSDAMDGAFDPTSTVKSGTDERYGDKVFVSLDDSSLGYYMTLDQNLDVQNILNNRAAFVAGDTATLGVCPGYAVGVDPVGVTPGNPAEVPFLGKTVIVTNAGVSSITALAGQRYTLHLGDTVQTLDGKSVQLIGVGNTNAVFTVDGGSPVAVTQGTTQRSSSGVEIYVDTVVNADNDNNDLALVVLPDRSGQATDTFNTNTKFIGEQDTGHLWKWDLANLADCRANQVTFGIRLDGSLLTNPRDGGFTSYTMNEGLVKSNHGYLSDGDYLCLPWRYACLVVEGPEGDYAYHTYTFDGTGVRQDLSTDTDVNDAAEVSSADVIAVTSDLGNSRGFLAGGTTAAGSVQDQTQTIWLWWNSDLTRDEGGVGQTGIAGGLMNSIDMTGNDNATAQVDPGGLLVFRADRTTGKPLLVDLDGDGTLEPGARDVDANGINKTTILTSAGGDHGGCIVRDTVLATNFGDAGGDAVCDSDLVAFSGAGADLNGDWLGGAGIQNYTGTGVGTIGPVNIFQIDNGDYRATVSVDVDQNPGAGSTITGTADLPAGNEITFHVGSRDGNANRLLNFYALIVNGIGNNAAGGNSTNIANTDGIRFFGDRDGRDSTLLLCYGGADGVCTDAGDLDVSGWTHDVRKMDGVIVKAPRDNWDGDLLQFSIPNTNRFEYFMRLAKPKSGSTSATSTNTTVASLSMMDTEAGAVSGLAKNVVAVGGPCVNAATRELLGLGSSPVCGSDVPGLSEGTGVLELKDLTGGKKALLVYGWEADDTRRAALVVKNADAFSAQLGTKNSVTVRGTDLTVSGITVA